MFVISSRQTLYCSFCINRFLFVHREGTTTLRYITLCCCESPCCSWSLQSKGIWPTQRSVKQKRIEFYQALKMIFAIQVSLAFLAVVTDQTFRTTEAFAPRAISRLQHSGVQAMATTKMAESRLTVEEEEVLFGEDLPPFPAPHRKKSRLGNILKDPKVPLNPLDHSSTNPLINKLRTMRETVTNCPMLWKELSQNCPDKRALLDEHMCDTNIDVTFKEMNDLVQKSAAVFYNLGITKGSHVAILGENSARWLVADHGIQLAGGTSAVRGADAPIDELRYVYEHSDSAGVAVLQGPKLLQKLLKDAKAKGVAGVGLSNDMHGPVKTIVLIHREKSSDEDIAEMQKEAGVPVKVFADLLEETAPIAAKDIPDIGLDDIATIVYTSGTTGSPKGVMLSHGNLIHQLGHRLSPTKPYEETEPLPGECMVSILPVWHITERTFELWMAARGCYTVYSSIRSFKNDLAKHKPEWMVLVPRVLEKVAGGVQDKFSSGTIVARTLVKIFTITGNLKVKHKKIAQGLVVGDAPPTPFQRILSRAVVSALAPLNAVGNKLVWSKVQAGFGGSIKAIISGGSALAGSLESFYETVGLPVSVGYGLTECSPLLSYRRTDANLVTAGCAGKATMDTEVRVVDPDAKPSQGERKALPDGVAGVVVGRGPQVMKGYYKNPEATEKAVDRFGWFDTGDLGRINPATGDLILTGRVKDTIVLSNGENIEPVPIEDAIMSQSPLIDQIMLTGQDGRRLVAVAVLNPTELVVNGFISKNEGESMRVEIDVLNDPKCTEEQAAASSKALQEASKRVRANKELEAVLAGQIKSACSVFRPWEQVGDVFLTMEPFSMANQQLTQSYKVKRASVMDAYREYLPK